jgi:hypothetical protein
MDSLWQEVALFRREIVDLERERERAFENSGDD